MHSVKKFLLILLSLFFAGLPLSFSQTSKIYYFHIKNIEIKGNKVSHESIIYRELTFEKGDSLTAFEINEAFRQSENNLLNTSLFNFAQLNYRITGFDINVVIEVTERWYIWPLPILEVGDRNLPVWLKEPDFSKLNYGTFINWNNFRGRRELLRTKLRFGYKEHFSLEYSTFNLDKNKKHGLNIILNKFRQHEVIIRNENDKPVYFQTDEKHIYESFSSILTYIYRPGLYTRYLFSAGYQSHLLHDDLNREEYLGIQNGSSNFFDFEWVFEHDRRDNKIYPLSGSFLRLGIYRQGLNLISDFPYKKTDFNLIASLNSGLKSRLYLENNLKIKLTKDEALPSLFEKAIGYNFYIRGFEHYTINGNSYSLLVNNLKYTLLPPSTFFLPGFSLDQFRKSHLAIYLNLFLDAAYIQANFIGGNNNILPNKILYSSGLGIDLVSYYDQVLRLELTINSLKEPGFYLHFETPFRRWFRVIN